MINTKHLLKNITYMLVVCVFIVGTFLCFYKECLRSGVPLAYEGDAFPVLISIKAYATGENNPITPRYFHQLNAPFIGSWSDVPSEKMLSFTAGQIVRSLGMVAGTTLFVLLLQISAGISFFACGRLLSPENRGRALLAACAILFGLAPYAFQRNLQHLTLTAYWHLPLLVLTLIWCGWPERLRLQFRNGLLLGCLSGFIAGSLNPYYLGPFLILLALLAPGAFVAKEWRRVGAYVAILGSAIAGFLIQNIDTFIYVAQHGKNHVAVCRDLWWLDKFGLYLPDLIFPRAHQNELINKISWTLYHSHVPQQLWGESQTAYIGVVSAVAFVGMMSLGILQISAKKFEKISPFFWLTLGVLFFSVAGGVNYLFGAFGLLLLRATSRSSILISCLALYFLCERRASRVSRPWMILIPACLVALGIWDQLPRYPIWEEAVRQRSWNDYRSDKEFFRCLEEKLPPRAMVFEMPVKEYWETGPIREMGDYEHFRPVLHTKELRYSYGSVKGRGDVEWQKDVAGKNPNEIIKDLERFGFSAILINRKAYEDNGESLKRGLSSAGAYLEQGNKDFLIFIIKPSANPSLPTKRL